MEKKKIFMNLIKTEFAPKLREVGFKGSGNHFCRINNGMIHAIWIQHSKNGGSCCIELGFHPTFFPEEIDFKFVSELKKFKSIDCVCRTRLSKNCDDRDLWWNYNQDEKLIKSQVNDIIETYFQFGEPDFEKVSNIEGFFNWYEKYRKDKFNQCQVFILAGDEDFTYHWIFARFHLSQNDINNALLHARNAYYIYQTQGKPIHFIEDIYQIIAECSTTQ